MANPTWVPAGAPFTASLGASGTATIVLPGQAQGATLSCNTGAIESSSTSGLATTAFAIAGQTCMIAANQFEIAGPVNGVVQVQPMVQQVIATVSPESLRPVAQASPCGLLDSSGSSVTGNTSYQSETEWYTSCGFRNARIIESGLVPTASGESEAPAAQATTYETFIEYPLGTWTKVTWEGGNSSITVQPGAQRVPSDEVFLNIPPNSHFGILKAPINCLTTDHVPLTLNSNYTTGPSGVPNETFSGFGRSPGTIPSRPAGDNGNLIAPMGIEGSPIIETGSLFVASDSIGSGKYDCLYKNRTLAPYTGLPFSISLSWVSQAFGGKCPITNFSMGGDLGANFLTSGNARKAAGSLSTVMIYALGTNDLHVGATLAQLQAQVSDALGFAKSQGMSFFLKSLLPQVTSTLITSFFTGGGGTQAVKSFESIRQAFNAWGRTLPLGIDGFIDDDAVLDPNQDGIYATRAPLYTGTASYVSGSQFTDAGLSSFVANSFAGPSDGLGAYLVYFTGGNNAGRFLYVYSHSGNTMTLSPAYQASAAISGTQGGGDPYVIIDPISIDGIHTSARGYAQIGLLAHSVVAPFLAIS